MRRYLGQQLCNARRSALVMTVALTLAACGGSASTTPESAPAATTPPALSPQSNPVPDPSTTPSPVPTPDKDIELSCQTVGVSIAELPARWNQFIDAAGFGFKLPDALTATGSILEFNEYTKYLDASQSLLFSMSVFWDPLTEQVKEVTLFGPVSDETTSVALTGTAGAMVFASTAKSLAEAEDFLVESLMSGVDNLKPGGFIDEKIEEDGLVFRFTLLGDGAEWSVVGTRPC